MNSGKGISKNTIKMEITMEAAYEISRFKRTSPRKEYKTEVLLSAGAMAFTGLLDNVSTGGALLIIKRVNFIKAGREMTITIPFAKKRGAVKRNAIVMWVDGERFGLQFI